MSLTGLAFLAALLLGSILAFAKHPIFGLVTYVGVFYLSPPDRWWGQTLPDLRWSLLAAIVTLAACLLRPRQEPRPALFATGFMVGLIAFVAWLGLQCFWALDMESHLDLLTLMLKYVMLVVLIHWCIDSERHLRYFLWAHVMGCFYFGWLAYAPDLGGRFEWFGGPGIGEANAGAMQIVTGILAASSLFLAGRFRDRAILLGGIPFAVNALVATISRSGFLATAFGGLLFNAFTPTRLRKAVLVLSALAAILFVMLTNPEYWARIGTIGKAGEQIEGVNTGTDRLEIIKAQWRMFHQYPLGCGHRCTVVLSPSYIDDKYLTSAGGMRGRSSHNTFMTLLVEQGIPGALFYVAMLLWLIRRVIALSITYRGQHGFAAMALPAIVGALGALTVGDMFVDYLKMEVRFWFFALLVIMPGFAVPAREATLESESPHEDRGLPIR